MSWHWVAALVVVAVVLGAAGKQIEYHVFTQQKVEGTVRAMVAPQCLIDTVDS